MITNIGEVRFFFFIYSFLLESFTLVIVSAGYTKIRANVDDLENLDENLKFVP